MYLFQAISSNFAFSWQKSPPSSSQTETFFLDWNYLFQAITSNFGFSWQKMPVAEQGHILYWIYPFHPISSNFRFSQQKSPHTPLPNELNREKFQTGSIHFRKFPATLGSTGSKASPFPRSQTGKFFDWIHPFQAISMNFGLSLQKNPNPGTQLNFLDWIYPFQAIFSNFGLSWQKSSLSGAKQAFFQTEVINFRQFPTTLGSSDS